uniref:T9SS type A sorting domain-containing protein n=1 Tax=candidate division WOR-3 bacterium TaxID=2052148 RepID=A0A7C4CDE7_UNCW3
MKRLLASTLALVALAVGSAVETFRFHASELEFVQSASGTFITLPGSEPVARPGAPILPEVARLIPLPAGTRLVNAEVKSVEFEDIPGRFQLAPAQPPAVLSLPLPPAADPDPNIYAADAFWPETPLVSVHQGLVSGRRIAWVVLRPVACAPAAGRLRLARSLSLRLTLEQDDSPAATGGLPDSGGFEYLIVTTPGLDTVFSPLADWRSRTGLPAAVRTMDWITSQTAGRDDAERLRNYLKACFADSGLRWVLLGGDVELIPVRNAFAMACSAGIHPREDSLPCDYYYSDLDGTWDANGNNVFGEVADSVDMFPDVFIGRAPVRTPEEARAFVAKVLAYETSISDAHLRRAVFAGLVLWEEPFTDEAVAKDRIDSLYLPPRFDPVCKLYASLFDVTRDTVVAALNAGFSLFNHCGHGWIDVMGLSGRERISNPDVAGLLNAGRFGIGYSIGCWTTAFDFDAIAEEFVRNPSGGGVAFIGNSSYGWGAPGNPGFGYSDRYDARFFRELFASSAPRAGELLARVKAHFAPWSAEANVYRWHQFCLNLIGDPALPVHTDTLAPIHAELPLRLPVGSDRCRIAVSDNSAPLAGAVVSITKPGETFVLGRTGADGTVVLQPACTSPGAAVVTISAPNHRPLQDTIIVAAGPHIAIADLAILDADSSGWLSPGESFSLRLRLVNTGTARSTGLRARLLSDSPLLGISSDFVALPAIAPGETLERTAFAVGTSPDAANGATALCQLRCADSLGAWWNDPFVVTFALPALSLLGGTASNRAGLPPGSGDTVFGRIRISNPGLAPAKGVSGNIFLYDSTLIPLVPALLFPDLGPGETCWSLNQFQAVIRPGARLPLRAKLGVNIVATRARCGDTLTLLIGQSGLTTADTLGWTHGGTPDIWRRTDAPEWTWHAGYDSAPYPPACNSWLLSPGFVLPESAQLRFFRRFDVPIYGADGMFVILVTAGKEETLDFIGSGGALRLNSGTTAGIVSDWFEESYNLSHCRPGDSARIRFSFVSDADPGSGRGFYIAAVSVTSAAPAAAPLPPDSSRLLAAFPNPFRKTTSIILALGSRPLPDRRFDLRIFDRAGKLVKTLDHGPTAPGYRAIAWDGRDDSGRPVPAGVYFLNLRVRSSGRTEERLLPVQARLRLILVR